MTGWLIVLILLISASCVFAQPMLPNFLGGLPAFKDYVVYRAGSWDRSGGNHDCRSMVPGQTLELMNVEGAGIITHFWCTVMARKIPLFPRWLVLRAYWDGEHSPSIEAPIGDFFCSGHGKQNDVFALSISCHHGGTGRNCWFPMPFAKSARITLTNDHPTEIVDAYFWNIDYLLFDSGKLPYEMGYFHAKYRQEFPTKEGMDYLILEAKGRGHFVGCNLSVQKDVKPGWFGEGDERIYIDGEEHPSIWGTGTEDYFLTAWSPHVYHSLFAGFSSMEGWMKPGEKMTAYRFHILDAIPFKESIRVYIEHAGDRSISFCDHYSSCAYWYQTEPHQDFFPLPPGQDRLPPQVPGAARSD